MIWEKLLGLLVTELWLQQTKVAVWQQNLRKINEASCAINLKMTPVRDTVVKTVNFIRASSFNHREYVILLREIEGENSETIYHTNVK
jgi:hypothetical protein